VFGEIASPSDVETAGEQLVGELADGRRLIDAGMLIDDFNRAFGVTIASAEEETVAGVLLDAFGELPAVGATIVLSGLQFTVDSVEHNRIAHVFVERLPEPEPPPDPAGMPDDTAASEHDGESKHV
jgi:CBS domain containing-hemolysin-like protein